MNRSVVIVAGGKGLRMGSDLPKQFLELNGLPVLMRTVYQFNNAFHGDIQIILVLPASHQAYWEELTNKYSFKIPHTVARGGETRFESVKNGLEACLNADIVGVHDGVRPLISESMIQRCYAHASKHGSALPVVPITQSLRKKSGDKHEPIDRDGVLAVQTPQCFEYNQLLSAYKNAAHVNFTDDATVLEAEGQEVSLVDGEASNLKITTPADLKIAAAILNSSSGG